MDLYLIVGGVVIGVIVLFCWSCLHIAREPDPLDPETRAQLARMQMRGIRRGEAADGSTLHPPASRSEYEGGHPPVGGGNRVA